MLGMAAVPSLGDFGKTDSLALSLGGDFRERSRLTKLVRQAVLELLVEARCDQEALSSGTIAAQELIENLVKYSNSDHSSLTVTVTHRGTRTGMVSRPDVHYVRLEVDTTNDATHEEIHRLEQLLATVAQRDDLASFYQERLATSSSRERSELGLLRLPLEAAMSVRLNVVGNRVHLHAEGELRTASTDSNLAPPDETSNPGEGNSE
jgi:hypothetical protein